MSVSSCGRGRLRTLLLTSLAAVLAVGVVGVAGVGVAQAADPGVEPENVELTLGPGQSAEIGKVVHTPEIAPQPDIVFMADTTGSMGGAIDDVKLNAEAVMNELRAEQPSSEFAVVEYRDETDGAALFRVNQNRTADLAATQAGINQWVAGGGGDIPEAYINALFQVSSGAVSFRPDSTRIIAFFGDAPSHDPSNGITEAQAIAALNAIDARVVAVAVGSGGLDSSGQATRITEETDGVFVEGVGADQVAEAILAGIQAVPVTVTPQPSCDPNLSLSFAPAERSVPSGSDANFTETVTVAAGSPAGTFGCTVDFLINGVSQGFVQHLTVHVPGLSIDDVTVSEGDAGGTPATFTVSLSRTSPRPVTVGFGTADDTAVAPADYTAAGATVTFQPGETSKPVNVEVRGDLTDEVDETFLATLSEASGAAIVDGQGVGTILDDDRNGAFSCRASVLKVAGIEPLVANDPDSPCQDDQRTLAQASLSAGLLNVRATGLDAVTDQTPDDLESAAPAAGDNASAQATVASVRISTLLVTVQIDIVQSQATAECVTSPDGLVPHLSGSSSIAGLSINGVPVTVGSAPLSIPLVIGTLHLNNTATTADSVTQRAVFLDTLLTDVVIAESRANFEGTGAHPGGNPCQQ